MTIEHDGKFTLPPDIQERSGLLPETAVRVIETRTGLLLVPLTDAPMNAEMTKDLQEWQTMGQETWAQLAYENKMPYMPNK